MPGLVAARSKPGAAARALLATLFGAYVLALPPHLVHHLLDPEDQPGCSYLVLSTQSPELQPDPPTLVSSGAGVAVEVPATPSVPPSLPVASPHPRAPPSAILDSSFA